MKRALLILMFLATPLQAADTCTELVTEADLAWVVAGSDQVHIDTLPKVTGYKRDLLTAARISREIGIPKSQFLRAMMQSCLKSVEDGK